MNAWSPLIVTFSAGLGLGLFFFGGLWVTIRCLAASPCPRLMFWGSFLIRHLLTIALFVVLCQKDWGKWAATMAGFLAMRTALLHKQTPHSRFSL